MSPGKCIVNLVDQISSVNYGIWHAAIATSGYLHHQFGIQSWLVAPESEENINLTSFPDLQIVRLKSTQLSEAKPFFLGFNPETTLIVSHGTWQYPTRWGAYASSLGFKWIYTPHGMLEPWSMNQKWLKKKIYFHLIEKRLASRADWVRAVGAPEKQNLRTMFRNVEHIPNGIYETDLLQHRKPDSPVTFLYLARLHHKKGVMPLVHAWIESLAGHSDHHQLLIAGTDDGEKENLEAFLSDKKPLNIHFLGPQFGTAKKTLLEKSHFYILPSQSEGFPTSVVEAMGARLIAIISEGCNFPESFEAGLAIPTGTFTKAISQSLDIAFKMNPEQREKMAEESQIFVKKTYLWSEIARKQATWFENQSFKKSGS